MTRRVAVLGGGVAGLTAAWQLSEPGTDVEVTLYQRGPRLGGKGASSRGPHGRIEEHGFHVWLGHYDNAFRVLRACYDELDRATEDPACPIRTWRDAFLPSNFIGIGEEDEDGWSGWLSRFPGDDRLPGDPGADGTASLSQLVERIGSLLGRLGSSMVAPPVAPRAVLSTRPDVPRPGAGTGAPSEVWHGLVEAIRGSSTDARSRRRAAQFFDFISAVARGIIAEGRVLGDWTDLDEEDISDWIRRHGASEETVRGPWVRGLHDLAFAYEDGEIDRPRFPTGLGLLLASKAFVDYKGALFWKMTAGMGDVVIAPMYQALRRRGVRFRFFHRLDHLHLGADGRTLEAITLGEQVALRPGIEEYDPLVRVGDVPVFPLGVDLDQLDADPSIAGHDLENHWCTWPDHRAVRLERGRDFDDAVLAVSLGMLPHVAGEILEVDARWRSMVEHVRTVATRAVQLWLRPDERTLGSPFPSASITGMGGAFDTYASMTHVLHHERWPGEAPRTTVSFCSVLPEASLGPDGPELQARATAAVRADAVDFLATRVGDLWPAARHEEDGFDWSLLADPEERVGVDRFDAQYWRANVDPSDRYVQAAPGTGRHRLRPDDSGVAHLALAGDWTDNGVNVGCIEAAVVSGVQAANTVLGRPLLQDVAFWRPQNRRSAPDPVGADGP